MFGRYARQQQQLGCGQRRRLYRRLPGLRPTGARLARADGRQPGNDHRLSAGNSGSGANTVGSPGTGKNVITVGAAENVHSFATANGGGNATGSDGCSITDTGADSANDVISFSSRGPTDDGRKKPEIQAPGTHVTGMTFVTTTSSGTGTAEATYRADGVCGGSSSNFFPIGQQWYTASSGTSHSAPAVAGGAALLHQQFINNPPTSPMADARGQCARRARHGQGLSDQLGLLHDRRQC
ncbi:MAG: S8 family serine peptidase [Rhodanobacteraceae bacterium]|nr:S8 family serine peptidase [Rhodanobacteraceae bacterium]